MKLLLTGGAGYIGSHTARQLSEAGHEVIVLDNLSTGFKENLIHQEKLVIIDLKNSEKLHQLFTQEKFEAVLHFAASVIVPESVQKPLNYFENNTGNMIQLLQCCVDHGVKHFIFSSTAAAYGMALNGIANEEDHPQPINPYGQSKVMSERILREAARAHGFNFAILRYFNVAGADPLLRMGQRNKTSTHLIKLACQTALGLHDSLTIYGTDYGTPDGTCIRDYIHVEDLANAHLRALDYLSDRNASCLLNVGYGQGYSVREVIDAVKTVTGKIFTIQESERREGDPPIIIAKADQIRELLNWKPVFNNLQKIIRDAWQFEQTLHR